MKKVIITGASGLLGQYLVENLVENYHILAIINSHNPFTPGANLEILRADLTSFQDHSNAIQDYAPESIFNCAAYNDVDGCESNREQAVALNVELVSSLIKYSTAKIIHFSTDYIFNGSSGPYSETDLPEPLNFYGQTKLKAESVLINSKNRYLIIRSNVLFGGGKTARRNFAVWIEDSLRREMQISVADDQFNNPIHAAFLARAAIEAAATGLEGIIHIGGDQYLSRYDFALKIARVFGLNAGLIKGVPTSSLGQIAKRPLRGGLIIERSRSLLKTPFSNLDESLEYLKTEY